MIRNLILTLEAHRDDLAIADENSLCTYGAVLEEVNRWRRRLEEAGLTTGSVVSLEGEYGLVSIGAFLALVEAGHIAVPMTPDSAAQHDTYHEIADTEWRIRLEPERRDGGMILPTGRYARHPLHTALRERRHPGLILFTSGSTGRPKAAVHDLDLLLAKYQVPRRPYRTLVFLLLDHIGGINTLFYTLWNGGTVVTSKRTVADVCSAIEQHAAELLPTSPTFLNLLLVSGEYRRHNLDSLKLVTYGTEPMPPSTLARLREALPHVRLQQTYGLTELGILRSQSRDPDSLWVKVGGEDFETKVVDGRLWIRARCAMLGYLNAPTPIDDEGYFDTGDLVEVDGEWLRFLGRQSDTINVGGSKVHPAEVESVLLQMDNVVDALVGGEPHGLTGQIVSATVRLAELEPLSVFKLRMRQFLGTRLAGFQQPARVRVTTEPLHSARFKHARATGGVRV